MYDALHLSEQSASRTSGSGSCRKNGVIGNYDPPQIELADNATLREEVAEMGSYLLH